jgi:hypothetical protein
MADLRKTAVSPHTMQGGPAQAPRGLAQTALDPLRRAYEAYQRSIGQPFQQAVRGGVRGYFGLPLMSDASATGREAYRQAEALGYTPGVGMPAGAVRMAAEGVQALPSIAGDIGRVIAGMPSGAGAAQAEDFARYQRSIPPSDVSPLTAFHGTPHTLKPTAANPLGEFRASAIGSGEGAQAYGYGLYFAESPGVAKGYQTTLSPRNFASIVEKGRNSFDVVSPNGKIIASNVLRGPAQKAKDAFDAQQTGSLYTVDIPDEMIGKMLDWDKPLSQQGQIGRSIIEALSAEELLPKAMRRNEGRLTGRDAYEVFSDFLSPAGASREFQGLGIPGIRYLDQGSRGAGDGTRNIVVFPGEESKVKILKRD